MAIHPPHLLKKTLCKFSLIQMPTFTFNFLLLNSDCFALSCLCRFLDILHEAPLCGHRKRRSIVGAVVYCFILASSNLLHLSFISWLWNLGLLLFQNLLYFPCLLNKLWLFFNFRRATLFWVPLLPLYFIMDWSPRCFVVAMLLF